MENRKDVMVLGSKVKAKFRNEVQFHRQIKQQQSKYPSVRDDNVKMDSDKRFIAWMALRRGLRLG